MLHRSKKDLWLFGLVWGAALAPLAAGLFNLVAPGGNVQLGWSLVRVGVVTAAAVLFTTYPLEYEIASGELVARSGLMRWRVPLSSIQEVSPSRNPASAPAWSLDRLRVEYLKGGSARTLYVSPEDKAAFLRDLADSTPGLELRGERASRVL
ncbi:MAG TPA: PH domain-containing protein [Pyrinomonadaceae bacterium]|nr:PH domain-containing protein [Pyrinomonadaceae bacterium]